MTHDTIRDTFDGWAKSGRAERMEEAHADVVEQVLAELDVKPGEKILDLGCGNGWATRLLAKAAPGTQAVGVDVSPSMIARADELHSFTIRARYDLGTFEELEFPGDHFDRAFSMEALYYSPDVDRALAELFRVLKPGGVVDVVLDCHAASPASARWSELLGIALVRRSAAEWRAAFEMAGFEGVTTRAVVDRRGPGDPAAFQPDRWCESWEERVATHAAGSLWIHARKPAG